MFQKWHTNDVSKDNLSIPKVKIKYQTFRVSPTTREVDMDVFA